MEKLPYFKFNAGEYLIADIVYMPKGIRGVFASICAHYWAKAGIISLAEIKRKVADATDEDLEILVSEKIIKVTNGKVAINFLDRQLQERQEKSIKNSGNGRLGGLKRAENLANAKNKGSESQANAKIIPSENIANKNRAEQNRTEGNTTEGSSVTKGSSVDSTSSAMWGRLVLKINKYCEEKPWAEFKHEKILPEHAETHEKGLAEMQRIFDSPHKQKILTEINRMLEKEFEGNFAPEDVVPVLEMVREKFEES